MSTPGNPFAAIAAGQDGQSQSAPSPSANGNPFSAIAATIQPSGPQQPTGISRLWTPDTPDGAPNPDNLGQIKDAAVGVGKSLLKGAGVIGDVATLGLTHLLPDSDKASAGINAPGKALDATNENQKYGSFIGDAATFELGSGIMSSLGHLPLAERVIQAGKALKVAQEHPVLAQIASKIVSGAAESGAGTLTATGSPKSAAAGAVVGGTVGATTEGIPALYRGVTGANIQPILQSGVRDALSSVADEEGVPAGSPPSIRDTAQNVADNVLAKSKDLYSQIDTATDGKFSPINDALANVNKEIRNSFGIDEAADAKLMTRKADLESKLDDVFEQAKSAGVSVDTIDGAKQTYKKAQALYDLDSNIKASAKGMRPNLAKPNSTPETIDPSKLSLRLNKMFDSGRLQEAVGADMAESLLQHSDNAERAGRQLKTLKTIRNVAGVVGGTGAVGGGVTEGVKHVLGGK